MVVDRQFIQLAGEGEGSINPDTDASSSHQIGSVVDPTNRTTEHVRGNIRNAVDIKHEVSCPAHKRDMVEKTVIDRAPGGDRVQVVPGGIGGR